MCKPNGVFLIEDLHTSYWPNFRGGLGVQGTFMEYAKPLTDKLNAFHSRQPGFAPDAFTRSTRAMHYYDSIIVFEKGTIIQPHHEKRGVQSWDPAAHIAVAVSSGSSLRAAGVRARRRLRRGLLAVSRRLPGIDRRTGETIGS